MKCKILLGRRKITDEELIPLLEAAVILECKEAKNKICQYMYNKLSLNNYYFYFTLSKLYKLKSLKKSLCNFLLQQHILNEVTSTFYKLSFEEFM